MKIFSITLLLSVAFTVALAQNKTSFTTYNRKATEENGVIKIAANENPGLAWLNNKSFTYGTISFEVKGRDVFQESFVGIAFHGLNDTTYEAVYFRPFNFKAKDSERKAHAVQYIAVPQFDWPFLRKTYHNQYEKPLANAPDPNDWFRVKIVVSPNEINVFVNDQPKADLMIKPLVSARGQKIGFWTGHISPGEFRNLKLEPDKQ